jgi:hypothetical protein
MEFNFSMLMLIPSSSHARYNEDSNARRGEGHLLPLSLRFLPFFERSSFEFEAVIATGKFSLLMISDEMSEMI